MVGATFCRVFSPRKSLYGMKAFFEAQRPHDGLSYEEYLTQWAHEIDEEPSADMSKTERKVLHYKRYNYERSQDVHEAYTPSEALWTAMEHVEEPQLWMVLTEPWCGDSAYNLPIIAEAAALSDRVTLRILYRDENLDIMDQYLTDGGRSIPKLVAFDEDGHELFTWGPRPAPMREQRQALLDDGLDGAALIRELLDRYEDGGWEAVDTELVHALRARHTVSP